MIKELCSIIPDGDAAKRECDKVIFVMIIDIIVIVIIIMSISNHHHHHDSIFCR